MSTQLLAPFSKTDLLRTSVMVRLNFSAKRAPKNLFPEQGLMLLLSKIF